MAISNAFGTTVSADNPTDPTKGNGDKIVSDFITVASLTNFSAMTGAIATAWGALRQVSSSFDGNWLPFTLSMLFALVSVVASKPGWKFSLWLPATFIAALNALTLFGAVIGATNVAT
jgi:hypothetical protein